MSLERKGPVGVTAGAIAVVGVAMTTCIVPDDIQLSERLNEHAVKIVEPAGVSLQAACACDPNRRNTCDPDEPMSAWDPSGCPQPTSTGVPHLLDPDLFPFCACPQGFTDQSPPLSALELFVEDLDTQGNDGAPKDEIYAALLVDYDPDVDDPASRLRYFPAFRPGQRLPEIPPLEVLGAEPRLLRRLLISNTDEGDFNPCVSQDAPLEEGWHQLTVLVTDRDWFSFTAPGDPDTVQQQVGVPDYAAGATQDTTHYSFFCNAATESPCDTRCIDESEQG